MKALALTISVCGALVVCGCGGGNDSSTGSTGSTESSARESSAKATAPARHLTKVEGPPPKVTAPNGPPPAKLEVTDLRKGTGVEAKPGDELTVQFAAIFYTTGKSFESSWERGKPFTFKLDSESVSPGWLRGLPGMRVGGRRKLVVPTRLISRFSLPPETGPESTLVYVIDLLEARPAGSTTPATTTERAKPKVVVSESPPPRKLVVKDIEVGTGPVAEDGDELTVNYVVIFYMTGEPLSPGSWGYGKPRSFTLGAGEESPGWERGLKGMRAGGRRELIVPPELTTPFGVSRGTGPEATLAYVIDLLEVD